MKTNPIVQLKSIRMSKHSFENQLSKRSLLFRTFFSIFIFTLIAAFVSCDNSVNEALENSAQLNDQESKAMAVPGTPQLLVSGLEGASGSTIGPGGALYVTEGAAGRLSRINPKTGEKNEVASGLPPSLIGIGGANDVAFVDGVAYVLVTLVDDPILFPTGQINGIYRVDGPDSFTIIADIGAFNVDNPPTGFPYFLSSGVLYAIHTYRGGFLVTDGHLNRVLYVTVDGEISIFKSFGNIVPTGLDVSGKTVYMAEAGPIPHLPENGKVVSFGPKSSEINMLGSGAPLLVDVEFNRGRTLFALAQGIWEGGPGEEGSPANPETGSLVRVNGDGTFTAIADQLNIPTSLEFIQNTAYIVTLTGDVWSIDNVASAPFGH